MRDADGVALPPPEFSRMARLPEAPRHLTLAATPAECAALAERFVILGVESLQAELTLTPATSGIVRVGGTLRAAVTQACVVTLEPVAEQVVVDLHLVVLPDGTPPTDDDPESPDEIESQAGMVDLGEAVAEQLALALNPYPRLPDAAVPDLDPPQPDAAPNPRPNPFATLAQLKRG
jgi:uncharacterized metal-binding protein YceD (DUF177 family)